MRSRIFPIALLLFVNVAHAAVAWGPTSRDETTQIEGTGDPVTPAGATVVLSAQTVGSQGFVGAMTAVDAAAYRGRTIELAANLRVTDGTGLAAIWLRADGPDGRLAFSTTAKRPVHAADGVQERVFRLHIPVAAESLKLGATLRGAGTLEATSIKLTAIDTPPSKATAHEVLDVVISAMEANALNDDRVDWTSERTRLLTDDLRRAPGPEAYASITRLLDALEDRHSFHLSPATVQEYETGAAATHAMSSSIADGVGYLLVPGFRGSDAATERKFSAELCRAMAAMAPRGWIVDLRNNGGGNMWPMIAGLRPLLGHRDIGAFQNRDGELSAWRAKPNGDCATDLSSSRVAVLIGPSTASSGEAVAVAFRGRDKTRFFGRPTAGVSTSNQGFPLPDGSVLMLTTAVFVDRAGSPYAAGLKPDVHLGNEDDVIEAARAWLRSQSL